MDIESRVSAVLKKTLPLNQEQIVPGALLALEDLGVSSLDRFELLMGPERGVRRWKLPEKDQDKMKSNRRHRAAISQAI